MNPKLVSYDLPQFPAARLAVDSAARVTCSSRFVKGITV